VDLGHTDAATATESLLCVKIASRGDLLLAGPAFERLRRARPDARIVLLVGTSCEDVARRLPYFDEIRTIDDRSLFAGTSFARARAAARLFRSMSRAEPLALHRARRRFSEVFIFHRDWRYALLARLARVPVRRGLARGRGRFLTAPYTPPKREHDAQQYMKMVLGNSADQADPAGARGVGPITLAGVWRFLPGEREAGIEAATRHGFDDLRPCVALGFGGGRNVKTRTSLKSWPIQHYRDLARRLSEVGCQVVWLGDREDARALGSVSVGINLAGRLSVPESAGVLSACTAAVANDSLLLHLAEAVGTPSVGIFGPTDPAHYRPLGPRSATVWIGESMACSPCHREGHLPPCRFDHRCMRELRVDTVVEKLRPLIEESERLADRNVGSRAG
jgi:ADP-heptose:LPS heptosyltransferase